MPLPAVRRRGRARSRPVDDNLRPVIFDEPTTALDVTTPIEVLVASRDGVEECDTAAIHITHDLVVVAQMADRIMALCYGDLVEESDTRSMLADPQEEYTKTLRTRGASRARRHRRAGCPP